MASAMVGVVYQVCDGGLECGGPIMEFHRDAGLQGLVPAFDLALVSVGGLAPQAWFRGLR